MVLGDDVLVEEEIRILAQVYKTCQRVLDGVPIEPMIQQPDRLEHMVRALVLGSGKVVGLLMLPEVGDQAVKLGLKPAG